jgi:hypothetical protein
LDHRRPRMTARRRRERGREAREREGELGVARCTRLYREPRVEEEGVDADHHGPR